MGGGDQKKSGATAAAAANNDALSLQVLCQYDQIPSHHSIDCTLLVKITATSELNEDRRAPVTLVATIDRSASMKDKLPLVKESLKFMVQQLRGEDKLAIITFDHEVEVVLPLTCMTSAGKMRADRAIESIRERGHTNLSAGLLAALQVLYETTETTLVESVVLFTDGRANYGIKDPSALSKATRSMLEQIGRQVCVFTLGFGDDHDPDTLHNVADAGKGLFYYVEHKDLIPDSFCDCLGGLLSVAAQNIVITLTAGSSNCCLKQPNTLFQMSCLEPNKAFKVTIPDIYCEEEKCIPLQVSLAGCLIEKEKSEVVLLKCDLMYFDVLNCLPKSSSSSGAVVVTQGISKPIPATDVTDDIELHMVRCEVADSLANASKLADRGDLQSARDLLHRCKTRVKKSVAFALPHAKYIIETLDESLQGLESQLIYKQHGKPTMMSYSHSHWQQRSSLQSGSTSRESTISSFNPYTNFAKTKMKVAYSQIHHEQ